MTVFSDFDIIVVTLVAYFLYLLRPGRKLQDGLA